MVHRPPFVPFSWTTACGSLNRQVKVAEYFTDGSGPTGKHIARVGALKWLFALEPIALGAVWSLLSHVASKGRTAKGRRGWPLKSFEE
jgi:hypothetical protein